MATDYMQLHAPEPHPATSNCIQLSCREASPLTRCASALEHSWALGSKKAPTCQHRRQERWQHREQEAARREGAKMPATQSIPAVDMLQTCSSH